MTDPYKTNNRAKKMKRQISTVWSGKALNSFRSICMDSMHCKSFCGKAVSVNEQCVVFVVIYENFMNHKQKQHGIYKLRHL